MPENAIRARLPVGPGLQFALLLSITAVFAGCDSGPPPAPPQPLAYSHKAHIDAGLECSRCHRGADRAKEAGIPEMAGCVACHRRRIPDHPEIIKLKAMYEAKEPIRWRKVNVMPKQAMVHFDHGPHARAQVECITCHGDVGQMTLARRVINTADMGWCISCHLEQEASVDCLTCHH